MCDTFLPHGKAEGTKRARHRGLGYPGHTSRDDASPKIAAAIERKRMKQFLLDLVEAHL